MLGVAREVDMSEVCELYGHAWVAFGYSEEVIVFFCSTYGVMEP